MPAKPPTILSATDNQPAIKLALEVRTPWTRWLALAIIAAASLTALAWAINSGNPKEQAAEVMRRIIERPTVAVIAAPTATPVPGEYTATLEIDPLEPKTPDGFITLTSTLTLGGEPVAGAKVHLTLRYWELTRDVEGGVTGPDGSAVLVYNIHRARGNWGVRVVSAFLINEKVVARADNEFVPVP